MRGATEAKQSPKIHFWSQHSCSTSTARPNSLDSLSWHLAVVRPLSLLLAAVEKEEQKEKARECDLKGETDMPLGIPSWAEYRSRRVEVSVAAGYMGTQDKLSPGGRRGNAPG